MKKILHVGLDVGSTTVKIIALNENKELVYNTYTRHFSDTKNTIYNILNNLYKFFHRVGPVLTTIFVFTLVALAKFSFERSRFFLSSKLHSYCHYN